MVDLDQIILGCKKYNKFAQKMLYEMYAQKMKGLCLRYVGDEETAKDLAQEGFIKVFSKIKQYKGQGSFEGWMKRVFVNNTISYIRKNNKKNKELNFEQINETEINQGDIHPTGEETNIDKSKSSAELVMLADLSENELLGALQKIPGNFRVVFNLFCIEKVKHDEIAKLLKIDVKTSRTRLSRARGLLKKELHAMCLEKLKE